MPASSPARPVPAIVRTLLTVAAGIAFIGAVAFIGATQPRSDAPSELGRGGPGTAAEDNA